MGSSCCKESLKSSPSNSFTNLKIPHHGERKGSTKSSRSRQKSGDSSKGKKGEISPVKVAPRVTNGVSQHVYPPATRPEPVGEDSRTPSYRLRQADLLQGDNRDGTHDSGDNRSTPTSQLPGERTGSLRLEQQLIAGHRRTGSTDVKKGHIRAGSGSNHVVRDRADSQKRVPADFIRKGSWTINEPKLKRGDSADKKEYSPVLTRNGDAPYPQTNLSQPSILADHHVAPNSRNSPRQEPRSDLTPPQETSIAPPTSPSMTRSDSCKNELNPVLRNKSHLQERRQVVSAITINTAACNGTETSSSNDSSRRQSAVLDGSSLVTQSNGNNSQPQQQLACVLKWKKGNLLGRGTFGKVYSALTDDGQIVAVKQIQLDTTNWKQAEADYKLIQREVDIQKTLNHPNIVKFLDCGLDVEDYTINIVMEHISGGTIASLLKKFGTFDEPLFQRYTSQLIDAVTYLHANNVVHRDIKGSNIMVTTTGFIKLIDFGTAKKTTDDLVTPLSAMKLDFCIKGTPYWMAPEVVQMAGEPTNKADVWSVGCTVIEMATGSPPYFHMQPMSALFVIGSTDKPSPRLPDHFSETARDFVARCLTKNRFKRPTASDLGHHRFMLREFIKEYPDNRGFYI